MEKIILKENFFTGQYNCTIASITNIFQHHGIPIEEYQLYLIGNGMQTKFMDGYAAINTYQPIYQSLIESEFKKVIYVNASGLSISKIEGLLKLNCPISVLINTEVLSGDKELHKEYGHLRSFLMYGIDIKKQKLLLCDIFHINGFQMVEKYYFELDFNTFLSEAKELISFIPDSWDIKIKSLVLKKCFDNLTAFLKYEIEGKSENNGLSILREQLKYVEKNFLLENEIDRTCFMLSNSIRFGTLIPMLSYLIEYLRQKNIAVYSDILNEIRTLKVRWNLLSNKSLKIKMTHNRGYMKEVISYYDNALLDSEHLLIKLTEKFRLEIK